MAGARVTHGIPLGPDTLQQQRVGGGGAHTALVTKTGADDSLRELNMNRLRRYWQVRQLVYIQCELVTGM